MNPLLLSFILGYAVLLVLIYLVQEQIIFKPEKLHKDFVYKYDVPFRELNFDVEPGVIFNRLGFDVWMYDYPGFGKTTGKLKEERIYYHAMQVRKLAGEMYRSDSIILYGRSLGSGIAAFTAANSNNRSLVLETPYSSIPSLFSTYAFMYPVGRMSNFKIPTIKYLEEVKEPVLILHGTSDHTIPLREAKRLKKVLKSSDKFVEIEGGGHNDLGSSDEYRQALSKWLDSRAN